MTGGRAASIRARLREVARQREEDFNLTLNRYAIERFLFRLSHSQWADQFVLKGALLFGLWFDSPHRPTRDADFLAFAPDDTVTIAAIVREVCRMEAKDGIAFDLDSIQVEDIREQARYGGKRVRMRGLLEGSKCTAQIDIGFGDAVTPAPEVATYPVMLADLPAPVLRVYPRETAIAEKLEAIVSLGMGNSRMKDFFDLRALLREGRSDVQVIARAIRATFDRRLTPVPEGIPLALTAEFSTHPAKVAQWAGFLDRNAIEAPALSDVVADIGAALVDPLRIARESGTTT